MTTTSTGARVLPRRQPYPEESIELVTEAIRSGSLYGIGGVMVNRFETGFAQFYGAAHAVASSSGTAAIHCALAALDPEPGSEVITAPITDGGTIIPIIAQGCVPIFADIDQHYGMAPAAVEKLITDRTIAILAVHLFGGATDVRALRRIADQHGITLIEDCSQAHATRLDDTYLGRFGHIGAYSLQQSKHLTTGDGGMTITDDPALAERMLLFRDKGWHRAGYGPRSYPFLGMNYRMTELQAAVGIPQLDTLPDLIMRRRTLASRIDAALESHPGIRPFVPLDGCRASYWAYPFEVEDPAALAESVGRAGFPVMPNYIGEPIYRCMSALRDRTTFGTSGWPFVEPYHAPVSYELGLCPRAEEALRHLAVFWMHEDMSADDVDAFAASVLENV